MPIVDRRVRKFAEMTAFERELIADTRAVIMRSLQILRDCKPETFLGRNSLERAGGPQDAPFVQISIPLEPSGESETLRPMPVKAGES